VHPGCTIEALPLPPNRAAVRTPCYCTSCRGLFIQPKIRYALASRRTGKRFGRISLMQLVCRRNSCPKEILGHELLQTTCKFYLGTDKRAAKGAHAKYLNYDQVRNSE
jgi:hypothetical protein